MNKIKALEEFRKKIGKQYGLPHGRLTQRQLGILMGYSEDQIEKVENGRRKMAPYFKKQWEDLEVLLKKGDTKIPD